MKWLAIANPAAGRPRQVERAVAALSRVANCAHEVVETTAPGDATRIAAGARAFDGLIAVGGDGTIGEIVNGMDLDRQLLAVLPSGHGNCLARDLGVATLRGALRALETPVAAPLDLLDTRIRFADGREQRRWCASTLAAGYVTEVVMVGRSRLAWLGEAAYAAAAMLTVPRPFSLTFDAARLPTRRTGVVINNTAHLSNFRGLPDASVRDGLLDVMELDAGWLRQLLHNLAVLAGSRRFGPFRLAQATDLKVAFAQPRTVMADGEILEGVLGLRVECRAGAARCVARP